MMEGKKWGMIVIGFTVGVVLAQCGIINLNNKSYLKSYQSTFLYPSQSSNPINNSSPPTTTPTINGSSSQKTPILSNQQSIIPIRNQTSKGPQVQLNSTRNLNQTILNNSTTSNKTSNNNQSFNNTSSTNTNPIHPSVSSTSNEHSSPNASQIVNTTTVAQNNPPTSQLNITTPLSQTNTSPPPNTTPSDIYPQTPQIPPSQDSSTPQNLNNFPTQTYDPSIPNQQNQSATTGDFSASNPY